VITHGADGLYAVVVDDLLGHHEAVIKSFEPVRGMTDAFSGATLLTDGRPALVVDAVKLGGFVTRSPAPSGVVAAGAQS
jgi:chemotaxis protein histidine kinase CheA